MSSTNEVVLLGFWVSPFAMRVKIALNEKDIDFEAREEDLLGNKSDLLLQSNPVYKKVPVLLHGGKPICESVIILNYIEEKWPVPALLPECPYERSVARFWAEFADKNIFEIGGKIWKSKREELEAAKEELIEAVKILEGALAEKDYFGGDKFGYTDKFGDEHFGVFKVEDSCPKFSAWMKRCVKRKSVASVLPEPAKVCKFVGMFRKMQGIE